VALPHVRCEVGRSALMDQIVAFEPRGFPMVRGARYRLLGTIPNAAFQVLPWNAPSPEDIAAAFTSAGFANVLTVMPWKALPGDWPAEGTVPEDAFVVRAGGVWTGAEVLPAVLQLPGGRTAVTVTQVWLHALPASAEPLPPPGAPGAAPHGTADQPPPMRPQPPPVPRPGPVAPGSSFTPEPLPPPRPPRGMSTGAKLALGGGAIAAAALLVAHAPFRRSRTA
jgi:hypothetical protein